MRELEDVSTEMEISLLGKQLGELEATLERWRDHMAWQEELAAYEADLESLARRVYALEKKVARDRNGEVVTIHFLREFPQTIPQFQTGEPAAVAA